MILKTACCVIMIFGEIKTLQVVGKIVVKVRNVVLVKFKL